MAITKIGAGNGVSITPIPLEPLTDKQLEDVGLAFKAQRTMPQQLTGWGASGPAQQVTGSTVSGAIRISGGVA